MTANEKLAIAFAVYYVFGAIMLLMLNKGLKRMRDK